MNASSATAVALLFDDAELGAQLRAALDARGARIVHEGALADLDRAHLVDTDADVVVVNLDGEADDAALDRLYDMIEDDRPRVVFNDAQASRGLDGWDRARWARHLAVKVLAAGDVDPPRPAPEADVAAAPSPEPFIAAPVEPAVADPAAVSSFEEPLIHEDADPQQTAAESESLEAELEALLAADGRDEAAAGDGTGFDENAGLPPLYDGDFTIESIAGDEDDALPEPDAPVPSAAEADLAADVTEHATAPVFRTGHLSLAGRADEPLAVAAAPADVDRPVAPEWSLLDDDALPAAAGAPTKHEPAAFGVEKLSAADFLAPEADAGQTSPIEPGLSLELVSLEEAVAPSDYVPHEFVLDEPDSALGRLVVLGATTEGTESVCRFLAALPAGLRVAVLHTQHLAGASAEALVDYLAQHATLPVRLLQPGTRARAGEVLVVPAAQQVRVRRDGSTELLPAEGYGANLPSIDASFTMAASVFGRDALAIVFAGHSNDAVGGCQAIHDRGGQVWVEIPEDGHVADMVTGIMAERLAQFSGTPQALAARLAEEFQREDRP